nr:immunoglobulin heavy chain junction region [Mus musculus]
CTTCYGSSYFDYW